MAEFANTQLVDVKPGRIGSDAAPTMMTPLATVATPEAVSAGIAVTSATAAALNMVTHNVQHG
ncbi:hypothetical protein AOB60_39130 [Streptomyces noursei]|uniref:Linaridin family RiPP n=1 Tax=Streptomyces noursei TaxID=1971 RepID=A0A2N8P567_STRNR|nr:hypothetical protein AOB60_39130 [Streptomyces noursei]